MKLAICCQYTKYRKLRIDITNGICYYVLMSQETQTTCEYEIGTEFVFNGEPGAIEMARTAAIEGLQQVVGAVRLEARMLVFDALHGTSYRQIRHNLAEQQRRERFEASIGLVAIGKK